MNITLLGEGRTKKNSMQIIVTKNRPMLIPSAAYKKYEADCLKQIPNEAKKHIAHPVNIRCTYYMKTHRRVDLVNLLEATDDILTIAGVIADDNSNIVAGHDYSRVLYDKENPRVEINITSLLQTEEEWHL